MTDAKMHKMTFAQILSRFIFITVGALIFAVGLELMLLPNNMLDGGLVGISIIISRLLGLPFGIILFLIHLPFIYFGYKQMGKWFAVFVAYGVTVVSIASPLLHHYPAISNEPLLAVIFGGVFVGAGVGIAVRAGGCLDGMEIVAIYLSKKLPFSVGEVLMVVNVVIFSSAAFLFSWEATMYSIISFFIASKAINVVVEGFNEMKQVTIISNCEKAIGDAIIHELERTYTLTEVQGGMSKEPKKMLTVFVSRLEEANLRELVHEIDKEAIMAVTSISDLRGGRFGFGGH
jgi:uncharacterized membrane-anchored protein YitT (DUF2179 family)